MSEKTTRLLPSGISYEWDLNWDIKTKEDAKEEFARLKKQLEAIPKKLERMRQLAQKDGFKVE